jgi:hypothetical protein
MRPSAGTITDLGQHLIAMVSDRPDRVVSARTENRCCGGRLRASRGVGRAMLLE